MSGQYANADKKSRDTRFWHCLHAWHCTLNRIIPGLTSEAPSNLQYLTTVPTLHPPKTKTSTSINNNVACAVVAVRSTKTAAEDCSTMAEVTEICACDPSTSAVGPVCVALPSAPTKVQSY